MENWRNISNLYNATVFDLTDDWEFLESIGLYEEDKDFIIDKFKSSSFFRYQCLFNYAQYAKDKDFMNALNNAYPEEKKQKENLYNE